MLLRTRDDQAFEKTFNIETRDKIQKTERKMGKKNNAMSRIKHKKN